MKNKIKELRIKKNMTQQQLADLVFVSNRTIISLEKEQYNPSIMLAYKIALVFNTTIEKLYDLEGNLKNEKKDI
ncbi:helix-turn-helix transcriptional regulator [Clostridium sp. CM028]|uniref:helix-turn-helix transcriptional regulator n=1 Tax=unclassified Clostridium TaxID=2614128 RepID=UPI001C0AD33D|nr:MULTISPECIES: helix-turn-helix transcriptional regulator [unclassified Clostridium]MBU3093950.1 helix-turn-helix transcriptional regulator [Clostridium sp. CF011]MBW9147355.1 helix-turn-helix transcriptional regulator [Clostridium sp. CM027]MBW9150604.1 helix-turn-helix transcriptional regulator [Clostridium sp. CM028]UVE42658.1 helix-turn-helix transcriptional regulator [Clostridium sp. CM027]WAG71592.1 helix-turn-helix transcriptional regulator [Clostridium sp. CF011]